MSDPEHGQSFAGVHATAAIGWAARRKRAQVQEVDLGFVTCYRIPADSAPDPAVDMTEVLVARAWLGGFGCGYGLDAFRHLALGLGPQRKLEAA
jgi:hypothetical protein